MGTCDHCDKDAVVMVNGRLACVDHIDTAMAPVGDVVRQIREELSDG